MMGRFLLVAIASLMAAICPTVSIAQDRFPATEDSPIQPEKALQVAVYDSPPFGFQDEAGQYSGLMVEIWEDIAEELDWQYEYTLTDMDGLLSGLQEQNFDVALGAISITPQRESLVDFTQAVNPSGTGVAIAAKNRINTLQLYLGPILWSLGQLIGSLLFVLFLSGTIVWLVERRHHEANPSESNIVGLSDGLWWSAVTMTTVGYGDKVPRSRVGKILGIVWIFASIILLSLFTANASAVFTTTKVEAQVKSVADLRNKKVGAAVNSSGAEFLLRERVEYVGYETVEDAVEAMLDEELDVVVSNVPVLKYLNNSVYRNELAIGRNYLLKNNMGIALVEESPLREPIDRVLLQKITEAQWQSATYKYFGEE